MAAHLKALLADLMGSAEIISARTAEEAYAALERSCVDVIAVGVDGLRLRDWPFLRLELGGDVPTRRIYFGLECDAVKLRALKAAGADGFVPWTMDLHEMRNIVAEIIAGRRWFAPHCGDCAARDGKGAAVTAPRLTPRQREVHRLLARGASNKDIAAALGTSPATVKVHVNAILKTLGAKNRTEAAIYAPAADHPCPSCDVLEGC
ncbi:LuxR family transcriptional regulator [Phenylobacterium kunshanense]|nr:response regulator transcription factor [Phenylobacterium kunshanense]